MDKRLMRAMSSAIGAIIAMSAAACVHAAAAPRPALQVLVDTGSTVWDSAAKGKIPTDSAFKAIALRMSAPAFMLTSSNARIEVSVARRQLLVIAKDDTLRRVSVAVATSRAFSYAGQQWRFATPRGRLVILGKRTDPTWRPPDWHYAEVAKRHGLKLKRLAAGARLADGSRLMIRDSVVGVMKLGDTSFLALPTDEHIVFDSTLFIPPTTTLNRHLHNELGAYALDLGDGYMLHGTWDTTTIGSDSTHGCIRLGDDDLAWVFTYVPVGVTVIIR